MSGQILRKTLQFTVCTQIREFRHCALVEDTCLTCAKLGSEATTHAQLKREGNYFSLTSNIVRVDNAFESVADDVMIVVVEVMSFDNIGGGGA